MPRNGSPIQPERVRLLNTRSTREGKYVLYWMQQSQRAECNHALEYAVQQANELGQPMLVVFGLMDDYPEANLRHYTFMLEGLQETQATLRKRGIKLAVQHGHPPDVALAVAKRASLIVCDRGYLRHQRAWREQVAQHAACRVAQVETDVVVPVEEVSNKTEYAARTIRPKIHKQLKKFLVDLRPARVSKPSLSLRLKELDLRDLSTVLNRLRIDRTIGPVSRFFRGGTSEAKKRLRTFIHTRLSYYVESRNQPQTDNTSHLSMYLHFGQISPLYIALQVADATALPRKDRGAFLEQLIVRRELAMNFVYFTPQYDSFQGLPTWAQATLGSHTSDLREHVYTCHKLEQADTHDDYWNAAQQEMLHSGYMHNYMRMYWSKKILEWSRSPEQAFRMTLALMNKYFLDARDPNAYTNVAGTYCLHDRPWNERPIFGKVRYMSAAGLERKADIKAYMKKVDALMAQLKQ